ncbi:nucleoside triphosphate pyrophosphohydrolase [Caldibacillus lycopersici]|uniref:Nucleoside triphosphate pyrophosphohydrolase n=1 Tax=Perspicuibacillus lycopersici TaxID=1325689 RepID=A0AAE3IUK5_9BACI|nr:nucleoside triphosphate pyrophosphohydrolase [Perspicuibacillus lycopersici]MCU9614873.1 nucleoside triphosphate pyrophosphohydrolase [Perspicuibacillus lycopersici]
MPEKIYNKLVRDKIPEIIMQENNLPFTHITTEAEVKLLLLQKLVEELKEFQETPNEEELADILEVIDSIAHAYQLNMEKVLAMKADKFAKRGGFKERIILEKVMEKGE